MANPQLMGNLAEWGIIALAVIVAQPGASPRL
jgi:hypothetical protein